LVDDVTGWPEGDFDIWLSNRERLFTFLYELNEYEKIIGAELTLRIRPIGFAYDSDRIYLESLDYDYSFKDLGWLPMPDGFVNLTLDRGNILGDNLLPLLQDGQLNVMIQDDCAIDYAILNSDITPTIVDIIDFINNHADIVGIGPGKSAANKYKTFMNMSLTVQDLIDAGDNTGTCNQMNSIMKKCDGLPKPPDFIDGNTDTMGTLTGMLDYLATNLGCE
jgi:hypothetical protein